jgi:hypothetical protein
MGHYSEHAQDVFIELLDFFIRLQEKDLTVFFVGYIPVGYAFPQKIAIVRKYGSAQVPYPLFRATFGYDAKLQFVSLPILFSFLFQMVIKRQLVFRVDNTRQQPAPSGKFFDGISRYAGTGW